MKHITVLLSLLLCLACNKQHSHQDHNHNNDHGHGHEHHEEASAKQGEANTHMHKTSTEELIKRFESPERDAYQLPEKVMDHLGDIQGKTIMDIGAGSGYFSVRLAERGAQVIAADVDEDFLNHVKGRIETDSLQGIETRLIPYDSPGLKDEEADIVFIVNTYHHIEDRVAYFKKVKQGTKAYGELVIIDFYKTELPIGPPADHKIAMDLVITELKAAGYTRFDVDVELLPYQYVVRAR